LPEARTSLPGCPAECRGCAEPRSGYVLEPGPLSGSHLALYSILTFILPLVTAVVGAWWASYSPQTQLMGGLLGLFFGMVVVRLCVVVRARFQRGEA
jgi:hypothetical protein